MNDQDIEAKLQAKGLTAPRITAEHVEDCVVRQQYHRFPGTTFIVCLLELKNGFTVCGESACASPANFDAETGMAVARKKALDKVWELEGYRLKQALHDAGAAPMPRETPFVVNNTSN